MIQIIAMKIVTKGGHYEEQRSNLMYFTTEYWELWRAEMSKEASGARSLATSAPDAVMNTQRYS